MTMHLTTVFSTHAFDHSLLGPHWGWAPQPLWHQGGIKSWHSGKMGWMCAAGKYGSDMSFLIYLCVPLSEEYGSLVIFSCSTFVSDFCSRGKDVFQCCTLDFLLDEKGVGDAWLCCTGVVAFAWDENVAFMPYCCSAVDLLWIALGASPIGHTQCCSIHLLHGVGETPAVSQYALSKFRCNWKKVVFKFRWFMRSVHWQVDCQQWSPQLVHWVHWRRAWRDHQRKAWMYQKPQPWMNVIWDQQWTALQQMSQQTVTICVEISKKWHWCIRSLSHGWMCYGISNGGQPCRRCCSKLWQYVLKYQRN